MGSPSLMFGKNAFKVLFISRFRCTSVWYSFVDFAGTGNESLLLSRVADKMRKTLFGLLFLPLAIPRATY
ncbi:MAG: hypothetical protein J6T08_03070, partial [Lentisphaeria bacterium]|nr:hypothetical protein [Lentisphaeria bacterium]